MTRRLIALGLALSLLTSGPALASGKEKAATSADLSFEISPVALPVIVAGRVRNYVFVTVRLTPSPTASVPELREKEAFFRDVLVRVAHRVPMTKADDYNSVNEAIVVAAVMAASPVIAGKGQILSAAVTRQQPRNTLRNPVKPAPPPVS